MAWKNAFKLYTLKCIIQPFEKGTVVTHFETRSGPPPLPSQTIKPKRTWRWLKFLIAAIAAAFVLISLLGIANTPSLEVRRQGAYLASDGRLLEIINTGTKPITISAIIINDRTDCTLRTMGQVFDSTGRLASGVQPDAKNNAFIGGTFAVGDKATYVSSCRIIRASVETDRGTGNYSFSSN